MISSRNLPNKHSHGDFPTDMVLSPDPIREERGLISLCTDIAHEKKIAGLPQICILTLSLRNLTQPNFNSTEFLHTSLRTR